MLEYCVELSKDASLTRFILGITSQLMPVPPYVSSALSGVAETSQSSDLKPNTPTYPKTTMARTSTTATTTIAAAKRVLLVIPNIGRPCFFIP